MARLDIVIFGATGFTGKYAVIEMVRIAKKHGLSWGVAGRSQQKLENLMADVAKKTGEDLSEKRVIIADVKDEKSLLAMCEQARVIVNCCGPYRLYGEAVVKAAIDSKTHHVDVSGEPQFMETMQLYYSAAARDAGVCVVSACGLDSIPNDMGVLHLQNNFSGTLNSVESYLSMSIPPELKGEVMRHGALHYGTWESLIYGLAHADELKPLRKKLYPERLPTSYPKLERRSVLHKRNGKWCVPFLGADESVVYRSQRALAAEGARRAQLKAYLRVGSWLHTVGLIIGFGILYILARFKWSRSLLLSYPRLFSGGLVSREGPSEAVNNASTFEVMLYGEGWEQGSDLSQPPNKKLVAKVSGANPGYGSTVKCLLMAAVTILNEPHNMPRGGVLTTAVAFRKTNLIKSLVEEDVHFDIINE